MSKQKRQLLILLAVGFVLHGTTLYDPWQTRMWIAVPAQLSLLLYLIALPIIVWRTHGENSLRVMVISCWLLQIAFWGFGIYLVYTE